MYFSTFGGKWYAFAGWSTQENGFGTTYGPNETISTGDLSSTGLTLFARWLPSTGTMQSFDATACSNLAEHKTIALTDNRDGNVYTVAKLKDGNCWMTSNLALNLADFAGTTKLTSDNTDIANNNASNTALTVCTSTDECYKSGQTTYYYDPGKSMYNKAVSIVNADPSKLPAGDTEVTAGKDGNYFKIVSLELLGVSQDVQFQNPNQRNYIWYAENEHGIDTYNMPRSYKTGEGNLTAYYNWMAATAESGVVGTTGGVVDSLRPAGWELPSFSSNAETPKTWVNLLYVYGLSDDAASSEAIRQMPVSMALSGYYAPHGDSTGPVKANRIGRYWTRVGSSTGRARRLHIDKDGLATGGDTLDKTGGLNLRCFVK